MANRGWGGWKDGRTEGRLEIHYCVLQDIGPLRPLPKKGGRRRRGRGKRKREEIKEENRKRK